MKTIARCVLVVVSCGVAVDVLAEIRAVAFPADYAGKDPYPDYWDNRGLGQTSVTFENGISTFELASDDRADAYADAFELK